MFAYVFYIIDKQLAKVPVGFIKNFDINTYDAQNCYKVFWSRSIHSIQDEKDASSIQTLAGLQDPPPKSEWNVAGGDGFYSAFILRLEDTLDALILSLKAKRPSMPSFPYVEDLTSSNAEEEAFEAAKTFKKREEVNMKKSELAAKRKRSEEVFNAAKESRKKMFRNLNMDTEDELSFKDSDSDSDSDPEVIPRKVYMQLKAAYEFSESENEKTQLKLKKLEGEFAALQKRYEDVQEQCKEVSQLRTLNIKLQEKLLNSQGECSHAAGSSADGETEREVTEVELAPGIVLSYKVYKEIINLDHVRKMTKSLAQAIWGSAVLAQRSVKGKACKNRNGPKKNNGETTVSEGAILEAKPPLSPEKLAVISEQMREYLKKRGKDAAEIEKELKKINKYISDKIQNICSKKN